MECPRCGQRESFCVLLYFGKTSSIAEINIGEEYPFFDSKAAQKGGKLPEKNPIGLGYTECPKCKLDFHCAAKIDDGRLVQIEPSEIPPPYSPSYEKLGKRKCPDCSGAETRSQYFNHFTVGRLICDSEECSSTHLFRCDSEHRIVEIPYVPEFEPIRNQ